MLFYHFQQINNFFRLINIYRIIGSQNIQIILKY